MVSLDRRWRSSSRSISLMSLYSATQSLAAFLSITPSYRFCSCGVWRPRRGLAILFHLSQYQRQQRHAHHYTVEGFLPVARPAGDIHIGRDLVHARQGMQQDGIRLGLGREQFARDLVVGGSQIQLAGALVAGLGVIGL